MYGKKHGKATSSQKFMSTIMTSGTLSDKISALTLAIQESPVHSIRAFESLVTLSGRRAVVKQLPRWALWSIFWGPEWFSPPIAASVSLTPNLA